MFKKQPCFSVVWYPGSPLLLSGVQGLSERTEQWEMERAAGNRQTPQCVLVNEQDKMI